MEKEMKLRVGEKYERNRRRRGALEKSAAPFHIKHSFTP